MRRTASAVAWGEVIGAVSFCAFVGWHAHVALRGNHDFAALEVFFEALGAVALAVIAVCLGFGAAAVRRPDSRGLGLGVVQLLILAGAFDARTVAGPAGTLWAPLAAVVATIELMLIVYLSFPRAVWFIGGGVGALWSPPWCGSASRPCQALADRQLR